MMKVRAKSLGYYGDRRRKEGEIFELVDRTVRGETVPAKSQFSDRWMEQVDADSSSAEPEQDEPKEAGEKKTAPHKGRWGKRR